MISKYSQYVVPGLGVLCVAGAVAVGVALRAPMKLDGLPGDASGYDSTASGKLELGAGIPAMEEVVEKHLFVKERKATGANTFPDLLVKGVYIGSRQSAVLSLKSRPEINLRIWLDDVDDVISRITEPRDPRQPIVNFLNEWDLKEITFKGVTVEHFITGEVETYEVDYTPAKHVKDSAVAGYGQGALAVAAQGGAKTAKSAKQQPSAPSSQTVQQRAQALMQLRNMVQDMTPEQRARFADRIRGAQGQQSGDKKSNKTKKSNSKKQSRKKGGR